MREFPVIAMFGRVKEASSANVCTGGALFVSFEGKYGPSFLSLKATGAVSNNTRRL